MRPEKKAPTIELGDDEKVILEILNSQSEAMDLSIVKEKSQLSGKKWDKASKNLTKNNVIKIEKSDDNLLIVLI
jgi:lysyl-tRNA synthetase class 2